MVKNLGMSENIGYIGFQESEYSKKYSDKTNALIDEEVNKII